MAKQTFTTGQVLTAAQMTSLQQTAMGGGSPSTKTASYVLVAADAGTVIQMNAAGSTTITVNTALFSAGDSVQIQNIGAGVCTITAGTATVNTAGSLALSQWEGGFLYFTSASSAIFFDVVQSSGMTNPMTTAGDTIYGGASGTPTRLAIGSTGNVLTVSGGNPVWAAPAAATPTFVGASAYRTTNQTIPNGTYTAITFDAENFDTDNFHNNSTNNSRMTIPSGKNGYYQIFFQAILDANTTGNRVVRIYKNGSYLLQSRVGTSGATPVSTILANINLVATDYIEIYVLQTSGGNIDYELISTSGWFNITYLGA